MTPPAYLRLRLACHHWHEAATPPRAAVFCRQLCQHRDQIMRKVPLFRPALFKLPVTDDRNL